MRQLLDTMRLNTVRQVDHRGRWITPWSGWLPLILIFLWSVNVYVGFVVLSSKLTVFLTDQFHIYLIFIAFFIVTGFGFFAITILFLKYMYQISTIDIGLTAENWRIICLVGVIIGFVKTTIVTIPTIVFFPEQNVSFGPPGSFYREPAILLLGLIVGVIIGPICEELIFRGIFYGYLRKRMRMGIAIAINTLIFVILHDTYPKAIAALLTGIIVCNLYERTGSLLFCIVIHSASNLFTSIGQFLLPTD